MLSLVILLFVGILINGIQFPNYDGTTSQVINANTWGVQYNAGSCNENIMVKTFDIDITKVSVECDVIIGFGTETTFFGLFIGMYIYMYIFICIYICGCILYCVYMFRYFIY